MTNYRAPSQQWAECEEWAKSQTIGATDACVLELRSRVEALEARENSRQQDDADRDLMWAHNLRSSTQRLVDEFDEGGDDVRQGIANVLRHLANVYDSYDERLHGVPVSILKDFADELELF